MTVQTLKSIGMNVDAQTMDWATIGARRAKKDAPDAGGWNVYVTVAGEFDVNSPITNAYLSAGLRQQRCPAGPATRRSTSCAPPGSRETVPAKRKELLDALPDARLRGRARTPTSASTRRPTRRARASRTSTSYWAACPTLWVLDK